MLAKILLDIHFILPSFAHAMQKWMRFKATFIRTLMKFVGKIQKI